jgi:hypothetical protein
MPSSSGTIALVGAASSVTANEVTQGTGSASFGTSDLVRLYSVAGGVCIDTANDIVFRQAGTSLIGISATQMDIYPDGYTINYQGVGDFTITGTSSIIIQSSANNVDISANSGASAIYLQSYKRIFSFNTSTSSTSQTSLFSTGELANPGASTSFLVNSDIAAVTGLSGFAAGYKITNIFYDANDGNGPSTIIDGITYGGTKTHFGSASNKIGSANNMFLNSDGAGNVRIQMTPGTSETTVWRGIVEVVTSNSL